MLDDLSTRRFDEPGPRRFDDPPTRLVDEPGPRRFDDPPTRLVDEPGRRRFDDLLARRAGVITWAQATGAGVHRNAVAARLRSGRWQRMHHGVFATFAGQPSRVAVFWAALLYCGRGAALSHESAAEAWGLLDEPAPEVHVVVPADRRVRAVSGLTVHRGLDAVDDVHPTRLPPLTRIDRTVIDLARAARSGPDAAGVVLRACGRRLTTPARLRAAVARRGRLRWRAEIVQAVAAADVGCQSILEQLYLRDVERAHRLPVGRRQAAARRHAGRSYDDVRYDSFALVVELDGRAAHPVEEATRDLRRDNRSVESGDRVLRYGWSDLTRDPCDVAAQVVRTLQAAGWSGSPRACGRRNCVIARQYAAAPRRARRGR